MQNLIIIDMDVLDIRFPTSTEKDGSDAMHSDPDYSCTYVVLKTNEDDYKGYGLTFTLGRGNEIVVEACHSLFQLVKNQKTSQIYGNFAKFWRTLTSDSQLRWIGPEKGVIHLATAAIVNALWDLWARIEGKPVWKLLVDMTPEQLVSTVDFRYIRDMVTEAEVIKKLKDNEVKKKEREETLQQNGYPAYTTQVGWLGYTDEKVEKLCKESLENGFKAFKVKVGSNLEDDIRRCEMMRGIIGYENKLMLDANQVWDVDEAIAWMEQLARYEPLWIEEPTSPDDVLGHGRIREKLQPYGIGVATGEMCANRVMFKQFLKSNVDFCQVDAARIGGINELLGVYFMAEKTGIPVCPHAGGIGLCEMVQHLQIWDYICLSQTFDKRMIEYVDQQHDYFEHPIQVSGGTYRMPVAPGYSTELKLESIKDYIYPTKSETLQLYQNIAMLKKWKLKKARQPKLVIKQKKGQPVNKKITNKAIDEVDNEIKNGKKNGKRGKKIKAREKDEIKDGDDDGKKDEEEEDGRKDEEEDGRKDGQKDKTKDEEKDKINKLMNL